MRESAANIGIVCPTHASKPGGYVGRDPKTFIGEFVKISFKCRTSDQLEHMWVEVKEVLGDGSGLRGLVNNDPVLDVGVKDGDVVIFTIPQIEDVYKER